MVMQPAEARERVARARTAISSALDDLVAIYHGRAWVSLGYESWHALCDVEFAGQDGMPDPPREPVPEPRSARISTTRKPKPPPMKSSSGDEGTEGNGMFDRIMNATVDEGNPFMIRVRDALTQRAIERRQLE